MPLASNCFRAALALCPLLLHASEPAAWESHIAAFQNLRLQGRQHQAVEYLARMLAAETTPMGRAHFEYWLGVGYHNTGDYERADRFYRRASDAFATLDRERRTIALADRASLQIDTGRLKFAMDLLGDAFALEPAKGSYAWCKAVHIRASALAQMGRFAGAEADLRHVLEWARDSWERASVLDSLAIVLARQGRTVEALDMARKSLSVLDSTGADLEGQRARVLLNVATLENRLRLNDEAERHSRESMALIERLFGPDHPDMLIAMDIHAKVLKALGRGRDAAQLRRQIQGLSRSLAPTTVDLRELAR